MADDNRSEIGIIEMREAINRLNREYESVDWDAFAVRFAEHEYTEMLRMISNPPSEEDRRKKIEEHKRSILGMQSEIRRLQDER